MHDCCQRYEQASTERHTSNYCQEDNPGEGVTCQGCMIRMLNLGTTVTT
jgi:hypothetical protein